MTGKGGNPICDPVCPSLILFAEAGVSKAIMGVVRACACMGLRVKAGGERECMAPLLCVCGGARVVLLCAVRVVCVERADR